MNGREPANRTLRVELWIFGTIMVLGMISSIFLTIVAPTPARIKSDLGLLCIVVATWADGRYRVFLGLTLPQIYREFRTGRRPRAIVAVQTLWLLGLGLLVWAWLGEQRFV